MNGRELVPYGKEFPPKAPWQKTLEKIIQDGSGAEIKSENSDIIISRINPGSAFNDWRIEINKDEDYLPITEIYRLKNDRGLVKVDLKYRIGQIPNIAGLDIYKYLQIPENGTDCWITIVESGNPIKQLEFNMTAITLVNNIEDSWRSASFKRVTQTIKEDLQFT